MNKAICDAINNRCVIRFTAHGHPRVAEPYAYGLDQHGHEVIHFYQTDGTARSGVVPDWKLLRVDKIESLTEIGEHFKGGRTGYVQSDIGMPTIFCEV